MLGNKRQYKKNIENQMKRKKNLSRRQKKIGKKMTTNVQAYNHLKRTADRYQMLLFKKLLFFFSQTFSMVIYGYYYVYRIGFYFFVGFGYTYIIRFRKRRRMKEIEREEGEGVQKVVKKGEYFLNEQKKRILTY